MSEQTILDLGDAVYRADTVLASLGMQHAIAALRAAGEAARADELEANIERAREEIREARIAAGFIPRAP